MKFLACLVAIFLIGCEQDKKKNYSLQTFSILSTQNMNNNSVVRVELVQIFNQILWNIVSKMKSKQYFENRKSLLSHNSQHMKVWSFEPLPRTELSSFCIGNWTPMCYGSIVFMSYNTDKKNSFTLTPKTKHLNIELGLNALKKISPTKKNNTKLIHRNIYSIGADK
ncbi:hypothetical protein [Candidatus Cytomitobacter primus]|uniref:Lipoprotein n=1 Tax=Candidatus Cytomitobacter primus TaxID=2066024 RepID=A0A5C0UFE7_9PROT|nr:hypothetical protein [Candidatus Cytomitobacter primus]QEK38363.1 hypothetical protein FZC34_00280 [Candidatus Cytomitobacter primus]